MASQGSFAIRPLIPDGATVRALNILKAADLLVDEEWVDELVRRPVKVGGEGGRVAGSLDPTMEVHLDEPLETAIAWGCPRLCRARVTWNLPAPFVLRVVRSATGQTFVIPATEPDLEAPLRSLPEFASEASAVAFHWEPLSRTWAADDDGGAGLASRPAPHNDPPLGAAEAEPPAD
jgi:hypothetical protein